LGPSVVESVRLALNNPLAIVDPTGLYNLTNTCGSDDKKCNKQFHQNASNLKQGLTDLQKKVDGMKDGAEKHRRQTALGAIGTENDHNNVNLNFGATEGGGAAETVQSYNEQTTSLSYNVIFDPRQIKGGTNDWAIDAAHEGTHVADESDPRFASAAVWRNLLIRPIHSLQGQFVSRETRQRTRCSRRLLRSAADLRKEAFSTVFC
jgi:hypothetical protein